MKRILISILLISMLLFVMTGCGGAAGSKASVESSAVDSADAAEAGDAAEASDAVNGSDSGKGSPDEAGLPSDNGTTGIYATSGNELTDFNSDFNKVEKPFSDSITSVASSDADAINATVAVLMPEMDLGMLGAYDLLSPDDLPKEEGKLMLSGYEAVREKSGAKISFSASHTYDEDGNAYMKGDKVTEKGTLDTAANQLYFESISERGGKAIIRTVLEAEVLKDGTHLLQYFRVTNGSKEGDPPTTTAVFKRFGNGEFKAISAAFDPDYNFKYDSILGKGDIDPEELAKSYTVQGILRVKDGKAEFSK